MTVTGQVNGHLRTLVVSPTGYVIENDCQSKSVYKEPVSSSETSDNFIRLGPLL